MRTDEFLLSDAIDVIEEVLASGGEFRMYPKGTSMLPLISQGRDSVVLVRPEGDMLKKRDVALYRRDNGQFVLHRVMRVSADGTFVMCGDNQTALEAGIRADQIIARVAKVQREGKNRMSGIGYRIYVFWWSIMPVRRGLLFLRRILSSLKRS